MDVVDASRFFSELKDLRISYFVIGGMAYDGLRGQITRKHNDIDMYVFDHTIPKLIDSIEGYDFIRGETHHTLQRGSFQADLLPLKLQGITFYRRGSTSEIWYPAETFATFQESSIPDLRFRIAPTEVLRVTSSRARPEDRLLVEGLPVDEGLLARIHVQDLT
jgi:hypothetical protein